METHTTTVGRAPGDEALDRALAGLRLRRAPPDLQSRVFAALAARQARRWWQQPVAEWPVPARAAVVAACVLALLPLWKYSAELSRWFDSLGQHGSAVNASAAWQGLQGAADGLRTVGAALVGRTPRWMQYGLVSASLFSVMVCGSAAWWMARSLRSREYAL